MADPPGILIVDDDAEVALAARMLLRRHTPRIGTVSHSHLLEKELASDPPDLVLLDLNFTPGRTDGAEGLAILAQLRSLPTPPAVIALTAYADIPIAIEALKRGATDFVVKPWDDDRLTATVVRALTQHRLRTPQHPGSGAGVRLMGDSSVMRELRQLVATVAPTEASIMILGENGVGKELIARAIHDASARARGTFLAVDMGALPEATVESELFGHCRGAFTDARDNRAGRFQACRGGTLFLDEIGNMSLTTQAKLLAAVERREITPVGADRPEAVDVRIVSATNLEDDRLRNPQVFRSDLLFRLNTIVVRVPPLRERKQDIPLLLRHYLTHYASQYHCPVFTIGAEIIATLCAHSWPGNVRALRHACERAVILSKGPEYALKDFGLEDSVCASVASTVPVAATRATATRETVPLRLDTREKGAIIAAMSESRNNISHAAKLLGLSRAALYRRLEKYGL
jgi:DNA-binding NtrC family response regulator